MKTAIQNFLNTPGGSVAKAFIAGVFTLYVAELVDGHQLFEFDWMMWKKVLTAAVISTAPMIINFLNPKYVQYGVTSVAKQVAKDERQDLVDLQAMDASFEDKNK